MGWRAARISKMGVCIDSVMWARASGPTLLGVGIIAACLTRALAKTSRKRHGEWQECNSTRAGAGRAEARFHNVRDRGHLRSDAESWNDCGRTSSPTCQHIAIRLACSVHEGVLTSEMVWEWRVLVES